MSINTGCFKEPTNKSITSILRLYNNGGLNLDPLYQRNFVWSTHHQEKFIEMIFLGMKINSVWFVDEKNDESLFSVLDGKQRLSTIIEFRNNKFKVKLPGVGSTEKFSYDDIKRKSEDKKDVLNKNMSTMINRFDDFQVPINIISKVSLKAQSELFNIINNSVEIGKEEKILAHLPYMKMLVKHLIGNQMKKLYERKQKNTKYGDRGHDEIWMLRILFLTSGGGNQFDSSNEMETEEIFKLIPKCKINGPVVNGHNKSSSELIKFASHINEKIQKHHEDNIEFDTTNSDHIKNMINQFGWEPTFEKWEKLSNIIGSNIFKSRKVDGWTLVYLFVFLQKKIDSRLIDIKYISQNLSNVKKSSEEFFSYIKNKDNREYLRRHMSGTVWKMVHEKLVEFFNLPTEKIKKTVSINERDNLFFENGRKCEICASKDDLQIDHVIPGKKIYGVLCGPCNRSKSDSTLEKNEQIKKYIKNKLHALSLEKETV